MTDTKSSEQAAHDLTEQEQGALTASDITSLQEYLDKTAELEKREPPMLSGEFWTKFFEDTKGMNEIPPEYQDKVCIQDVVVYTEVVDGKHKYIPEGKTEKGYCDVAWEKWNSERTELERKYRDIIIKALRYSMQSPSSSDSEIIDVGELLQRIIDSKTAEPPILSSIITKKIKEIAYPVDKVNSNLWGLTIGEKAELKAESDSDSDKGKQASIYVLIDFEETENAGITISRPLTKYDRRIFTAAANLKDQGHDTVTTAQIYEAMGNRGKPNTKQREKILKRLEIMSMCRVSIDNTEEAKLYTKYDKVKCTFYLLPTTIGKGYVNGLMVDDAISIMEIPRLYTFAKNRGQFSVTPVKLLETPLNQTEDNLSLEDYILTRILRMKNAIKQHRKNIIKTITLETLYKNCNIDNRLKKSRVKDKIESLLNYYKKQGFIKGFTLTSKNIEIDL